jgi:hypothetical protein
MRRRYRYWEYADLTIPAGVPFYAVTLLPTQWVLPITVRGRRITNKRGDDPATREFSFIWLSKPYLIRAEDARIMIANRVVRRERLTR